MPENLQNNPWFQLVLVVLLACALVYAGRNLFPNTNEMQVEIDRLEENITTLSNEVEELRRLERILPQLRQAIREKEKELETLKKIIPPEDLSEELIRRLENMAAATGISVKSYVPRPYVPQEFYKERPIDLTASGTYHNLGKFFAKISNFARIINIKGVRINANTSGQGREIGRAHV